MSIRHGHVRAKFGRRGAALLFAAAAGTAGAVLSTGTAAAATQPDLAISQRVSGSSQHGHTLDTITIRNGGTASATHVNVEMLTTTSGPFTDVAISGQVACEVMPAPPPYDFATACQVSSSIDPGAAAAIKFDFGGTAGAKFTNLAQVGEFQADGNIKNNTSTLSSWFGPGADLALSGTAKTGTVRGHATTVTTAVDHGPNDASSLQETIEAKSVSSATAHGTTGSCQVIAPATGYSFAAACVTNSLATGAKWTLTIDYHGTSGKTMTVVTKITSLTKDPNTANNTITKKAKLK
jgi:hypothetical protein